MVSFAQRERRALANLFVELGPGAPTLCEGWRTADLAAHLVLREHRPDAAPGMVTRRPPFGPWTDRLTRELRDSTPWDELVARARSGPPAWLRPLDPLVNSVEFFVHHEDVRRAQPAWEPRELAAGDEDLLWARARPLARFARYDAPSGLGSRTEKGAASTAEPSRHLRPSRIEPVGRAPLQLGGPGPIVRGPVSELVLWLMGRQSASRAVVSAQREAA